MSLILSVETVGAFNGETDATVTHWPKHRVLAQFGSAKTFYIVPNAFAEEFCPAQTF